MGRILCLRLFILLPTPRFALSVLRVNKTVVLLTRKNWTRMGPAWEHHHVCKKKQIAVRILRLRLFILLPTPSSLSPSLSPSLSLSLSLSLLSLSSSGRGRKSAAFSAFAHVGAAALTERHTGRLYQCQCQCRCALSFSYSATQQKNTHNMLEIKQKREQKTDILFLYVRTYVWFVFVFCVSVYSCVRTYVCALRRSLRFAWGLWSVFWGLTGFDCWGDRWCSVLSSKRTHRDPFTDLSRRRRYVDGEIDSSIGSGVRAYVRT